VTQGIHIVTCPHERFQKSDLERLADGQRTEFLEQLLDLSRLAQIAARHMVAEYFLAIFAQPPFVRLLVHAVNRLLILPHEARSDSFVGQHHEFFDQLVRDVVLNFFDARNASLFIEPDFVLGEIEVERTGFEPQAPDALGEFVCFVQHSLNRADRLAL